MFNYHYGIETELLSNDKKKVHFDFQKILCWLVYFTITIYNRDLSKLQA